jgi:hypothetical protein
MLPQIVLPGDTGGHGQHFKPRSGRSDKHSHGLSASNTQSRSLTKQYFFAFSTGTFDNLAPPTTTAISTTVREPGARIDEP